MQNSLFLCVCIFLIMALMISNTLLCEFLYFHSNSSSCMFIPSLCSPVTSSSYCFEKKTVYVYVNFSNSHTVQSEKNKNLNPLTLVKAQSKSLRIVSNSVVRNNHEACLNKVHIHFYVPFKNCCYQHLWGVAQGPVIFKGL